VQKQKLELQKKKNKTFTKQKQFLNPPTKGDKKKK